MQTIVVIPAYNESSTIAAVINDCAKYCNEVIVVNDGSNDDTALIAKQCGATVLSHAVNRGYGATLKTGLMAAQQRHADAIVTIDADLQHEPSEITRLIAPIQNGTAEIVIGNRFDERSKQEGMSRARKALIIMGNMLTWLLYGVWLSDTQSGFRAYTKYALTRLSLESEGMEFSSEVIGEAARNHMRIALVPITIRYTDYSLGKGQNMATGVKTAFKLFLRRVLR